MDADVAFLSAQDGFFHSLARQFLDDPSSCLIFYLRMSA